MPNDVSMSDAYIGDMKARHIPALNSYIERDFANRRAKSPNEIISPKGKYAAFRDVFDMIKYGDGNLDKDLRDCAIEWKLKHKYEMSDVDEALTFFRKSLNKGCRLPLDFEEFAKFIDDVLDGEAELDSPLNKALFDAIYQSLPEGNPIRAIFNKALNNAK